MGILYYPNEIQKKRPHRIDIQMREATTLAATGAEDLTGTGLSYRLSRPVPSWKAELITLHFSGATARDIAVSIETGLGIISGLNDAIWIGVSGTVPQRVTIDEGFYTGTTMATELKTQLDAETAFVDLGVTFTVAWSSVTRKFTITPSAGTATFLSENTAQSVRRNSLAGHVLGLTVDQTGASISSDTALPSLGSKAPVVDYPASVLTDVVITDGLVLDEDSAIAIDISPVALTVHYSIKYKITDDVI